MKYDILKSGLENVLALLNQDNSQAFTLEEISIGAATEYTDPLGINTRNTEILVTAIDASVALGNVTLRYTRIDLTEKAVDGVTLELVPEDTLETVLAKVAAELKISPNEVEFAGVEVLPELEPEVPVELVLSAVVASYGYIGSVTVSVSLPPLPVPELEELLPTDDLEGFTE